MARLSFAAIVLCVALGVSLGLLLYVAVLPFLLWVGWICFALIIVTVVCSIIMLLALTYHGIFLLAARRSALEAMRYAKLPQPKDTYY